MAARHADTLTCCHSVGSSDAVALRRGVTPHCACAERPLNCLDDEHGRTWVMGSDFRRSVQPVQFLEREERAFPLCGAL